MCRPTKDKQTLPKKLSIWSQSVGSCLDEVLDQYRNYPYLIVNSVVVHRKHIIDVIKWVTNIDQRIKMTQE